jgi:hypothetical protein
MRINLAVFNCFNLSNFLRIKKLQFVDFTTWIFIRISLLWDLKQRKEYRQFYEIKRFSEVNNPGMYKVFKEKVLSLCNNFSDEEVAQHLRRLNGGKIDNQPYFNITGDEKACVKAHEVFEMLSMKWESGVPINRDRFSVFWHAHIQAIRVENIFFQALASEKNIILTKKALEYCRFYDDFYLGNPICFTSFSLNLAETEKNLTKNIEQMPKDSDEIENYCVFFSQIMKNWSSRDRKGLLERYLYSNVYKNYPDKKIYIIALLRALEKEDIYTKYSLKKLLKVLKEHLETYSLPRYFREEHIIQDYDFFINDLRYLPFEILDGYKRFKESLT